MVYGVANNSCWSSCLLSSLPRQVASFVVLDVISGQEQLNQLLETQTAAVTATLTGSLVTMPLAFVDYMSIQSCAPSAQQLYLVSLASVLTNSLGFSVAPSQLTSSCSYSTIDVGGRRRSLLVRLMVAAWYLVCRIGPISVATFLEFSIKGFLFWGGVVVPATELLAMCILTIRFLLH